MQRRCNTGEAPTSIALHDSASKAGQGTIPDLPVNDPVARSASGAAADEPVPTFGVLHSSLHDPRVNLDAHDRELLAKVERLVTVKRGVREQQASNQAVKINGRRHLRLTSAALSTQLVRVVLRKDRAAAASTHPRASERRRSRELTGGGGHAQLSTRHQHCSSRCTRRIARKRDGASRAGVAEVSAIAVPPEQPTAVIMSWPVLTPPASR